MRLDFLSLKKYGTGLEICESKNIHPGGEDCILGGFHRWYWYPAGVQNNRKWIVIWVVVSNIIYVHFYLGKIPILTNVFQMGWNHQLVIHDPYCFF